MMKLMCCNLEEMTSNQTFIIPPRFSWLATGITNKNKNEINNFITSQPPHFPSLVSYNVPILREDNHVITVHSTVQLPEGSTLWRSVEWDL